jgi:hypothetical protein
VLRGAWASIDLSSDAADTAGQPGRVRAASHWLLRALAPGLAAGTGSASAKSKEELPVTQLTKDDIVGWGGETDSSRPNYPITDESSPATMGSSIGWILQLDGDNHRNAFLNSPWVKAVIPIRVGKESEALDWLKQSAVEGSDGLDEPYFGNAAAVEADAPSVEAALLSLAEELKTKSTSPESALAGDKVYETGFEPLEGGFRASGQPFDIYDQWIESVPTDEIVATPYDPTKAPRQPTGAPSRRPARGLLSWLSNVLRFLRGKT